MKYRIALDFSVIVLGQLGQANRKDLGQFPIQSAQILTACG